MHYEYKVLPSAGNLSKRGSPNLLQDVVHNHPIVSADATPPTCAQCAVGDCRAPSMHTRVTVISWVYDMCKEEIVKNDHRLNLRLSRRKGVEDTR